MVTLNSCVQEFDSEISFVKANLFVQAELKEGNMVSIDLLKTTNFGEKENLDDPNDAVVILNNGLFDVRLMYDDTEKKYINRDYIVESGTSYALDVSVPQSEYDDVTSSTTVPEYIPYNSMNIESQISENHIDFDLAIEYESDLQEDVKVHQIAYFFIDNIVSQNGNVDTIRSAIVVYPELSIANDEIYLNLEQRNGLLYSTADAEQGVINLKLKANYTLSPNQTVTELFIETRVVDEAYYDYHSKLTKQILLEQNDLGEPVITRSNIVNGYGVFSAYAVSIDSYKL